jgi:hypothetical protein
MATTPPRKPAYTSEGMVCDPLVVIVYSSIMIGIRQDLPGLAGAFGESNTLQRRGIPARTQAVKTHGLGNPLVAGSSPARPTSEPIFKITGAESTFIRRF